MKVYKYRFLVSFEEEDENGVIKSQGYLYRGVPLQFGEELVLLQSDKSIAPWTELEELNCKVAENEDKCDYYFWPMLDILNNEGASRYQESACDAPVRKFNDEALDVELDDFVPLSEWEDKNYLGGRKLNVGDRIDILIHDGQDCIDEANVYAILEGKMISYKNQDGGIELFLEGYPGYYKGPHSFKKIFEFCDCRIRLAID